jgi:malate dehydrogenase
VLAGMARCQADWHVHYGHPTRCQRSMHNTHVGLKLDDASKERLRATEAELVEERDLAAACLAGK